MSHNKLNRLDTGFYDKGLNPSPIDYYHRRHKVIEPDPSETKRTLHLAVLSLYRLLDDSHERSADPLDRMRSTLDMVKNLGHIRPNHPLHPKLLRVHHLIGDIWGLDRKNSPDPRQYDRDLLAMALETKSIPVLQTTIGYFGRSLDYLRAELLAEFCLHSPGYETYPIYNLLNQNGYAWLLKRHSKPNDSASILPVFSKTRPTTDPM